MMRAARAWTRRLLGVFTRGRDERALTDELESHLQMHIADNIRAGMDADEARRRAVLALGGVEQTKERMRDRQRLPALDAFLQDVRYAARLMRRSPGFTLVATLALALGIGANTAMFSVVNTLLLRPLPYANARRLLLVRTVTAADRRPSMTAVPDFEVYRARNRTFDGLASFYLRPINITGGEEAERVSSLIVSSEFLSVLDVQPILGRGLARRDEQWGSHRVAVLTDGLWKRRFGADPGVLHREITLNDEPYEIVGVLPPKFSFVGIDAQLLVPMSFAPGDNLNTHNNYFLTMVGRLAAGATADQADADLNRLAEAIIADHPENKGTAIGVVPLQEALVGGVRRAVVVLLAAVAFVLLIACANLANLLLARAAGRHRETAIRLAVGATRHRLVRQFLTESVMLSIVGGAAGVGLAAWAVGTINLLSQRILPRAEDVRIDPVVLAFAAAVAIGTGVVFGLAPAFSGARLTGGGLNERTRAGDPGGRRIRGALVIAEVALSLMLLIGAGLMMRSVDRMLHVDAGFDPTHVITMQVGLPANRYIDRELARRFSPLADARAVRFFTTAIERVREVPGVNAAGAINGLPLMGEVWGKNLVLYDRPAPASLRDLPPIQYRVVVGDYFRALGIRVRTGRAFADGDGPTAPKVAIVNRELVRRYWNGADPVGKTLSVNPPRHLLPAGTAPPDYDPGRFTVIGVADDARYGSMTMPALPLVYVPYAQGAEGATSMVVAARIDGDPHSAVGAIRERIRQIDPDLPIANVQTMDERVATTVAQPRVESVVLGAFALLAIVLAAIGVYGVMSYSVAQRTAEIGVRMALGAERRAILALVLGDAARLVVVGAVLGIGLSLAATRTMRALLFEVSATDPAVFGGMVALIAAVGILAAAVPAIRAARVDPLAALRYE
jgi:putative ABC transport system permease protein